ncbi:MAG TPA: ZIP family metal transporter [Burkholderiales bacterium]|nr:ZIP family metal transporter [Burkholderiales bacterium]
MTELILRTQRAVYSRGPFIAAAAATLVLFALAFESAKEIELAVSGAVQRMPAMGATLIATLFTALATGAGAVPILVTRGVSARAQTTMLGFSAGVMLAASIFSLMLPALAAATSMTGSKAGGAVLTCAALLLGAALLLIMDRVIPHEHPVQGVHGTHYQAIRRVWLFVFAITLHNVPEGLAIGVSFAGDGYAAGMPLALGIAVQNVPEGLAVALAMLTLKYTPGQAALIALATGLVEPLGGLLGAGAIAVSGTLLPWGLGFAAGAMLFVISHEIIPESHRNGRETSATIGLFIGFVLMMLFDTVLA